MGREGRAESECDVAFVCVLRRTERDWRPGNRERERERRGEVNKVPDMVSRATVVSAILLYTHGTRVYACDRACYLRLLTISSDHWLLAANLPNAIFVHPHCVWLVSFPFLKKKKKK